MSAEKEIDKLKKDNETLKKKLSLLETNYSQLLNEVPKENCDPRRLLLLKNRLFQLERQCHSNSIQMNERQFSFQHAHNTLLNLTEDMESWLASSSGTTVKCSKTDFVNTLKTIRGISKSFTKHIDSSELVEERNIIRNKFKVELDDPTDLFNHNRKQIGELEHKLSQLNVSLEKFKRRRITNSSQNIENDINSFKTANQQFETDYNKVKQQISDCCHDLTLLSLLKPQLPKTKKVTAEVTIDMITAHIKKFTRRKEVLEMVTLVWQICQHRSTVACKKFTMLDEELGNCHQRLELHTKFVLDIVTGIESMFSDFEKDSLVPTLTHPLSLTLEAYIKLQNNQNNETFTKFFKEFDDLLPKLEYIVKLLKNSLKTSDASELQKVFKSHVYNFTKSCLNKRHEQEKEILAMEKENDERKERMNKLLK